MIQIHSWICGMGDSISMYWYWGRSCWIVLEEVVFTNQMPIGARFIQWKFQSYFVSTYLMKSYLVLSYFILYLVSYPILSYLILSYLILSSSILFYLFLFFLFNVILSYPVLAYLILSYLYLSVSAVCLQTQNSHSILSVNKLKQPVQPRPGRPRRMHHPASCAHRPAAARPRRRWLRRWRRCVARALPLWGGRLGSWGWVGGVPPR